MLNKLPVAKAGMSAEELIAIARELGEMRFAPRSAEYDREAKFPTENYEDLRRAGFLALTIPAEYGGIGADFETYCRVSAELGRWCGATALTFNMHAQTTFWTGAMFDSLPIDDDVRATQNARRAKLYDCVVNGEGIFAQPFSEPNSAAAAGKAPFGTTARKVDGGWIVNGVKHFASLAGAASHYSMACTIETDEGDQRTKNAVYLCVPADADGFEIIGSWDPLGMRATVSMGLKMEEVFVPDDLELLPPGAYYRMALKWPHMFFTLSPSYMGLQQGAFDFTVKYLRGEVEGVTHKSRSIPAKQHAVSRMRLMLEQSRALFEMTISEAAYAPSKEARMRAYAAQHTIMEHAQEICALALRTCGGRTLLKSFPLERMYRESRCGSLMLPWTAEITEHRLGDESLYEPGEKRD
ncbi:acyl-CoA dehydrogenase family protein [Pseudahrensia aquimaris]|uniref:Acyl-CoA dehydrogenase family protein n=1 Tax=Pseudahrensia aquimaris TaxID=744461 RepID=A0ABW3FH15_9HYPH